VWLWLRLLFTGGDMTQEFETLLARYWDLAYLEGKSGISQGDKANEVLFALRNLKPSLPDVLTQEYGDSAQYVEGWNECREVMAGMMK
jgi:hypothetical protein